MAYDERLAERIRANLKGRKGLEEKKMFGGLTFMLKGRMCCGITKENLMVRVLPESYDALLQKPHAAVMDFTGRALRGFLYVRPAGYESEKGLKFWLDQAVEFADTPPAKKEKRR